jgi:hypothetical protein
VVKKILSWVLVISFLGINENLKTSPFLTIPLLKNLEYQNNEVKKLRKEVKENIFKSSKSENIQVVFRKYVIKKDDNFFSIMAKTMLDHDTLSSINFLASLWDIHPGSTWLVPNARGIAAEGSIEDIVKKYKIDQKYIFPIPGKDNYYFVVNRSFDPLERDFLNGTVFIKPVGGVISSKYGVRVDPFTNKNKFHRGIDIACTKGSTVRAAASGKVVYTGVMGGYGNLVIIEHENGYQTMYGHLKSIMVKGNNLVKQGDQIGLSGDTGKVTGPHLHFEVKRKGKNIHPKVKDYSMH